MLDDLIPVLGPALAVPVLALLVNAILAWMLRGRTRELRVLVGNRDLAVTVPGGASAEDVATLIERHLHLRERVRDALEEWRRGHPEGSFREGTSVDFLASSGDRRVAIEVRTSLAGVTLGWLARYVERSGASAVVLVLPTGQMTAPAFAAEIDELPVPVALVQVPVAGGAVGEIVAAVERLLPTPVMA